MRPTAKLLVLVLCLLPAVAAAHEIGLSNGAYQVGSSSVTAHVAFAHGELIASYDGLDVDGDGALDASEVRGARGTLDAAIVQQLDVRADGRRCPGTLMDATVTENIQNLITLRGVFR